MLHFIIKPFILLKIYYKMDYKTGDSLADEQELAYDLRQYYAKIVGEHLIDVAIARKDRDMEKYLKGLQDLYTIVRHKFKISKKKNQEIEEQEKIKKYKELYKKAVDIINEYPHVYLKQTNDSEGVHKIEEALRDIEMFLYAEMDEASMFGSKWSDDGL